MKNAKMIGFGLYTPKNLVENERLQEFLETSDEWIRTRTGIERRYISLDENTSDLAVEASKKALSQAGLSAEDIDLIILATVTPDNFTPSTACIVQDKLGAKNAWAFDINAACTGFIYALKLGKSLIRSGEAKNALIIGAETLSKALNWEDRGSCVLFGDGAGATVLTSTEEDCGIKCVNVKSDGSKGDSLVIQGLPLNSPFKDRKEVSENYINMNGREIFKFATKVMEESIVDILEKENMITVKSDNKKTLVTIENYSVYQDVGNTEETQEKQQSNTEITQKKIKKNSEKNQKKTNKNDKERYKNDKEGKEGEEDNSQPTSPRSYPSPIYALLANYLTDITYRTFFEGADIKEESGVIKIKAQNEFSKGAIQKYIQALEVQINKKIEVI